MSHTDIDWADEALDDLREVVKDSTIITKLMCIAWSELRERPNRDDLDEGEGRDGLLWRRGITRAQRLQIDPRDLELDAEYQAWDFVIIYRMRNMLERRRHLLPGFVVLRVISNAQLYDEFLSD